MTSYNDILIFKVLTKIIKLSKLRRSIVMLFSEPVTINEQTHSGFVNLDVASGESAIDTSNTILERIEYSVVSKEGVRNRRAFAL